MDTILDFSLVKAGGGSAYAPSAASLNLENLNMNTALGSLLKINDCTPSALLQHLTAPTAPALIQLLQQLRVNVTAAAAAPPPIDELLHLLQAGQHSTTAPPNAAAYALLIQQQLRQRQQQQSVIQPANDLNTFIQNIGQLQAFKTNLSSPQTPALPDSGIFSPSKSSDRPIKPTAKRPKIDIGNMADDVFTELGEANDAELRRKTPPGAFFEPQLSTLSDEMQPDESALACDVLHRNLTCLRPGGGAPLTPSRASSLTSSASCASSTQNSPSSASLRRHSSASTAVSAAMSMRGTPQRRAAAPIPDNLKDEAYFERRKKNNDAAKRSRDQRRRKEEETAQKANALEQECTRLRTQVCLLQAENKKLHALVMAGGAATSPATLALALSPSPVPDGSAVVENIAEKHVQCGDNNNNISINGESDDSLVAVEQPLLTLVYFDSAFDE